MTGTVALAVAGAAITSWLVCQLVIRIAPRIGVMDVPNIRSSHQRPTARAGGLGVAVGVLVGLAVLIGAGVAISRELYVVMSGFLAIACLCLLDDIRPMSPGYRLLGEVIVAGAAVGLAGSGIPRIPLPTPLDLPVGLLAAPLAILWLVAVTNFYNFMDGIDGLAGGQCVASCLGIALAGFATATTDVVLVVAGAATGFVILNFPRARIFLGDVGSTSIGYLLAALPLALPRSSRSAAVFAVAVGLSLFLLDPLETLVRRLWAGRKLGVAHREHNYQLAADTPNRMTSVAALLVGAGFLLSCAGALAFRSRSLGWPAVSLALLAFAVEKVLVRRRIAASSPKRPR